VAAAYAHTGGWGIETKAHGQVYHAVHLFWRLQGESPENGALLNSAGDFREFSPKKFEKGATGDFQQLEKPAIGGPFRHQRRKFSETRTAWLGREDSNPEMANWNLRGTGPPGFTSACSAKASSGQI
jgi:hypothetical protein